ncbi:putative transcriptional regulator [Listeria weihenstephanensis FSL R9-0317]|uniref:PTS sugar transporter subunit IIA n=1 Tax=Listeria weihenstephanensis TaxID=1006155 RepID=A0A1S7FT40_9LIST|nr:sigma-54-dependent transcriptional regulator [Listeria weihenstephanensis]AQY50606.1 PTS sugar transporter subunit IIA [Listeria weihenstephanensis]EUJ38976.1 putative transcriptional regulator [Listeria weihenstephanensis FSL R9-0317]
MKRIERIYQYMQQHDHENIKEQLEQNTGITATEISESLGILRNNVSMELNELHRQGKIIKITGRPVLYFDRQAVEKKLERGLEQEELEFDCCEALLKKLTYTTVSKSPFDDLIGSDASLRTQVEQAKAAVLYPPNGLHTLIVGQTGVGKTLFANLMYRYSQHTERLSPQSPFIIFNCADYYNNPQLLMSHIFGHTKGAFTGADNEKEGLVEKANGGILFLDEIHRLPPEGQEMIFYLMDTGTFNKLGETDRSRKSNILIIGATTEDPESSLLRTFVRRIPIVISLPSLEERTAKERVDLLKNLLSNEAHRISKPLRIEDEAAKALIGNTTFGNIGQLKSNIQLVCAQGFLNSFDQNEEILIDFKTLPINIKDGFFHFSGRRKELQEISKYLDPYTVIMPERGKQLINSDDYEPDFNLYKIIEDKASILMDQGVENEDIKKFITMDIDVHLNSFYNKFKSTIQDRENILKIVNEEILNFTEDIQIKIEQQLGKKLNDRFVLAFSLHLTSFLKRARSNKPLKYTNIENVVNDKPESYAIALEMKKEIEAEFQIRVPNMEVLYLTLLISSLLKEQEENRVAVLVATHGNSTATSMVNVAKKLLGEGLVDSIDMPLDLSPKVVLDKITQRARELDMGRGVLLLVDMGSLTSFGSVIAERTGIPVRTIDMVSTATVIEAVRKSNILDMDLDSIYDSLKDFRGYGGYDSESAAILNDKPHAIVTICASGEGTAEKLQAFIERILETITTEQIKVIPIGVHEADKKMEQLQEENDILMIVGIHNPKVEIPFIPIERLFAKDGEEQIIQLVKQRDIIIKKSETNWIAREVIEDSLNEFLTYLNPKKIVPTLLKFASIIETELNYTMENTLKINLLIHVGCAMERMVIKDTLIYHEPNDHIPSTPTYEALQKANTACLNPMKLALTADEQYYICDIITNTHIKK